MPEMTAVGTDQIWTLLNIELQNPIHNAMHVSVSLTEYLSVFWVLTFCVSTLNLQGLTFRG